MSRLRSTFYLFSLLALVVSVLSSTAPSATAQDRSVPRFGPLVGPDTVEASPFDLGRMWSFAKPPVTYLEEKHDVTADERGLAHARLGVVRLPGCSGSIVSPDGLVLTSARCVRSNLLPAHGDSLQTALFYAAERSQERELVDGRVERVVDVEDVTDQVDSLVEQSAQNVEGLMSPSDARRQLKEALKEEVGADYRVDVVREAGGTRSVAYQYERYDARLVFLPEREVTAPGSSDGLFSYPQFSWDVAALRLYGEDGPVQTPDHYEIRTQGARPGDTVFAVGFPGDTRRVETHQQLAFRRDVRLPAEASLLESRISHLHRYSDTSATSSLEWQRRLHEERTALKRVDNRLEALRNDYFMRRLQRRDEAFQQRVERDSSGSASTVRELTSELASLQTQKRTHAESYRALSVLLQPKYASAALRRALLAHRAVAADGAAGDSTIVQLSEVTDRPPALDAAFLEDQLRGLRMYAPSDSASGTSVPVPDSAKDIVASSVFSQPDSVVALLRKGDLPHEDPALRIVSSVLDASGAFMEDWHALETRERQLTDSLAQARFQQNDHPVALPASRSLRFADGRVRGYPYNGTVAPPFTTFYGLYAQHFSVPGDAGGLPERWLESASELDRTTPLATVATTDVGGGEYGGPLLNGTLQLVGVRVDGNVQTAGGHFLFLPNRMRSVSVDIRAVLEGLSTVYEADTLVRELRGDSTAP